MDNETRGSRGFESLGEILGGQASPSSSPAQRFLKETRVEELVCGSCQARFQAEVTCYWLFGKERQVRPQVCPQCRAGAEAKEARQRQEQLGLERVAVRERWRRRCGIAEDFQLKTFRTFDRTYQARACDAAVRWAEGFWRDGPRGYPSLVLYSAGPGVGKSHLMVAIANHIIQAWQGDPQDAVCPVRFESGPGLVRRIRATYDLRPDDDTHEREADVYAELRGVRLLMLDDVGKESPSRHTREVYWYIVDERVKSGLPVVVSTRLPLSSKGPLEELMGEDTVDRLVGMVRGQVLDMTGRSYRRLKLVP